MPTPAFVPAHPANADPVAPNRRCIREAITVFLVLALVTAILSAADADMRIARFCHNGSGWRFSDWTTGLFLYDAGRSWMQPALFLAIGSLVALPFVRKRPASLRAALFFPLLLALGPGLTVNAILKDHWGRPRPCQIVEFGGAYDFRRPWEPGDTHEIPGGGKKASFPSGHASMAFFMMAPWFVLRYRKPRAAALWLAAGMGFGLFVGVARITQGGHFATDILWSGGFVYLTGLALSRALRIDVPETRAEASVPSPETGYAGVA